MPKPQEDAWSAPILNLIQVVLSPITWHVRKEVLRIAYVSLLLLQVKERVQ